MITDKLIKIKQLGIIGSICTFKRMLVSKKNANWINDNRPLYNQLIDVDSKKAQGIFWKAVYGKSFPWNNPVTLNEKIIWLSAMTDTSKWTEYSDKYEVRKYIESLGLKDILTECYGVWDSIDDVDFNSLPDTFVIKCTHDCGSTIIVKDKGQIDVNQVKKFLNDHLKERYGYQFCEPHYTKIKPRVMAEGYINELGSENSSFKSHSSVDYKIWCLNGKAEWVFVCYDRYLDSEEEHGAVFDIYDVIKWIPMRQYLSDSYKNVVFKDVPRPKNLEMMVEIAEKISTGFPQVRVDLYNVNGKIYFGEMTFTSQGGRMSYYTEEFQKMMGEKVDISEYMKK